MRHSPLNAALGLKVRGKINMRNVQNIKEDAFIYLGSYLGGRELILNAHLIMEEVIDMILQEQFIVPAAYNKASLRFKQKILLLEATKGPKVEGWIYSSLKAINTLRNSYAHVLEPSNKAQKIRDFLNTSYEDDLELETKISGHLKSLAKSKKLDTSLIELQIEHYDSNERLPRAVKRLLNALIIELSTPP
ncbi:hypothetical protein VVDAL7940_02151 [Vibrio vulnificus]|nr:hypothetical protein VVDAL7940_02151 [Vibrio vulnificus]